MTNSPEFTAAVWPSQDARDRAVASVTPIFPAPEFGCLPPLALDQHRFVAARNGLFVQARSNAMAVCLRLCDTLPLPYGELEEFVILTGGLLPASLFHVAVQRSVEHCPNEWAGIVVWNRTSGTYRLVEPAIENRTPGSISYTLSGVDRSFVVVDLHSHGRGQAYFSPTDDRSDAHGIYLACVLGTCERATNVTVATRIVVNGIHYEVPWSPWSDE